MSWRMQLDRRHSLVLPTVAVQLLDEFSGAPPSGELSLALDYERGGSFFPLRDRRVVRTPSGVSYFPNLGHSVTPSTAPDRRYRVRVIWSLGRALYTTGAYPSEQDGALFEVEAWNRDHRPPGVSPPRTVYLLPGPDYPFAAHVPLVRGTVRDSASEPVVDALVEFGTQERVLTDAHGQFALPLRWAAPGPVDLDLRDHLGRSTTHTLTVPDDLGAGHDITIA